LTLLRELLRWAARRPVTAKYPFGAAETVEGLRAKLLCDRSLCVWCRLCVTSCPSRALDITTDEGQRLIWNMGRCLLCGLCEAVCPRKALSFSQDFELAFIERGEMTVTINEKAGGG
jgi:NADH-quinone oxidoreductase subunit I